MNPVQAELPIHFFTIVLNGIPFIRYHIDALKNLPFEWHWHIVEGVADLKHDTSWSLASGGRIPDSVHDKGLSNDGTSAYLDELTQEYPQNITVYRKAARGEFWDGKLEMVNAPLKNIQVECLLWQVDADEIWTGEQICKTRQLFINHPERFAAFYWCDYFVGTELVISSRNCYAQNPAQEWLRTWRFRPHFFWAAHEPPVLVEKNTSGEFTQVPARGIFTHEETEKEGLVFQHYAYVIPEQLQFKEVYYGYKNALAQWRALQQSMEFPVKLKNYFSWVGDETTVDTADSLGIRKLITPEWIENNL